MAAPSHVHTEVYSPREIARAAGVADERAIAAAGSSRGFVPHAEAVRIGRALRRRAALPRPLFSTVSLADEGRSSRGVPLALSTTLHAGLAAAIVFVTTLGLAPSAATLGAPDQAIDPMRLVFTVQPGPGGGGGGGGRRQPVPPPRAMREGRRAVSSPLPARHPPPKAEPTVTPPEPKPPPLAAEALPPVAAPIVTAPADDRDRPGVLLETGSDAESRGPGEGGGAGTGRGTGIGSGDGSGVGDGSGGGTGGGPYRPGAGIEPPRLVREVKAGYTDAARRANVEGEAVLEIVVRRDGSVGDVTLLRRLGSGLDERAVQAVRQWRFEPARRHGTRVDVIVEVAVEFRLR